jgi:hypothetical protein
MLQKDQNKRIDIDQIYQALEDINLKQLIFKKSIESKKNNDGK